MTYQPFLPEVAAGSVESRFAAVSLRNHLHPTKIIAGTVTAIDHATRSAVAVRDRLLVAFDRARSGEP
ncbi:MAG TPA: hypothetical protein VIT41_13725 [Microlunatus sp.]